MTKAAGPRLRIKRLIAHTAAGMVVMQILSFLSSIVLAHNLTAEDYGTYQLLISTALLTTTASKLGLDAGLPYVIPRMQARGDADAPAVAAYALGITLLSAGAIGAVILGTAPQIETTILKIPGIAAHLGALCYLLPTMSALSISCAWLRAIGRSDFRAIAYYYTVGSSFLLIVWLYDGDSLPHVFAIRAGTYLLGAALALTLVAYSHKGQGLVAPRRASLRELHQFSVTLVPIAILQQIVEQPLVDLALVGRLCGPDATGPYAAAARVASGLLLLPAATTIVAGPVFSGAATRAPYHLLPIYMRTSYWQACLAVGGLGAVGCASHVVMSLFGEPYASAEPVLIVLSLGFALSAALGANSPVLLATGFERIEALILACTAAFMLAAGIALATFGPIGIATASALSAVVCAGARLIVVRALLLKDAPTSAVARLRSTIRVTLCVVSAGIGLAICSRQVSPALGLAGIPATLSSLVVFGLPFLFTCRHFEGHLTENPLETGQLR